MSGAAGWAAEVDLQAGVPERGSARWAAWLYLQAGVPDCGAAGWAKMYLHSEFSGSIGSGDLGP